MKATGLVPGCTLGAQGRSIRCATALKSLRVRVSPHKAYLEPWFGTPAKTSNRGHRRRDTVHRIHAGRRKKWGLPK